MAPHSGNAAEFSFRTRQQAWDTLRKNNSQLLNAVIIGGGIVGAGLLREFSLHGIPNVALFEKGDFASGTSSASSKLIHAGIRYLEQVWTHLKKGSISSAVTNLIFVVAASRERKILGKIAPHLIKPKPICLVLGEGDPRSVFSVALGTWLYYLIQLLQGQFFSPPRYYSSKEAIRKHAPEIDASAVKAIVSFWDSETDDARLVIENLQDAHRRGAQALNYVELLSYKQLDGKIEVELMNKESGEKATLQTKVLINAAGAFVESVNKKGNGMKSIVIDRVAGSHIDVYPALTKESYYVTASDKRLVFVLTRNEDGLKYTRIGTTERVMGAGESSDQPKASPEEISYLKSLVKEFFPNSPVNEQTIVSIDTGIRPLRHQEENAFQKSREHEIIEDNGVYHVIGVKLTDFRRVASELFKKIPREIWGESSSDARSSESTPLRAIPNPKAYAESTPKEFVEQTMVIHWEDYLKRRRGIYPRLLQKTNPEQLKKEFQQVAEALGWNRNQFEIESGNK